MWYAGAGCVAFAGLHANNHRICFCLLVIKCFCRFLIRPPSAGLFHPLSFEALHPTNNRSASLQPSKVPELSSTPTATFRTLSNCQLSPHPFSLLSYQVAPAATSSRSWKELKIQKMLQSLAQNICAQKSSLMNRIPTLGAGPLC